MCIPTGGRGSLKDMSVCLFEVKTFAPGEDTTQGEDKYAR